MKTKEEIAQWVINNRYPKSEKDKVPDVEMYHKLVESIEALFSIPRNSNNYTQGYKDGWSDCSKDLVVKMHKSLDSLVDDYNIT